MKISFLCAWKGRGIVCFYLSVYGKGLYAYVCTLDTLLMHILNSFYQKIYFLFENFEGRPSPHLFKLFAHKKNGCIIEICQTLQTRSGANFWLNLNKLFQFVTFDFWCFLIFHENEQIFWYIRHAYPVKYGPVIWWLEIFLPLGFSPDLK